MNKKDKIITKFGNAKINNMGYYQITNSKEGNHRKLLHRLIFEDFYGPIPDGCHIHHKDGDKTNNCIMNLQLLTERQHKSLHRPSEETRKKMSESHKGKKHSEESKRKMSENNANSKYTIWNNQKIHYNKWKMFNGNREPNPCKCFYLKYDGKDVNIGGFYDFVSCEIIGELIKDAIGEYE